jgi:5-methylcytosine-specific restriction protein A
MGESLQGVITADFKSAEKQFEVVYVNTDDITTTRRIRDVNEQGIAVLAKSINEIGLLEPVVVAAIAEDEYVLISGLQRLNACISVGMAKVPAIVAPSIKTSDIPIVSCVYNHVKPYSVKEVSDYVDYLLKERKIKDFNTVEFIIGMPSGDVAKLQDLKADNDSDILEKLFSDELTIGAAFKKLETKRKKQSKEAQAAEQAKKALAAGVGVDGSGERGTGEGGGEMVRAFNPAALDEGNLAQKSLDDMVAASDATEGFKPNKQKVGQRERICPTIRKATFARDNYTCQCCMRGGEAYVDSLDYHHTRPVALGGEDSVSNGVTLCILCHRLVHLFGNGQLQLPKSLTDAELAALTEDERAIHRSGELKFKRVVIFGQIIRDLYVQRGIDRKAAREQFPVGNVGRKKPSEDLHSKDMQAAETA